MLIDPFLRSDALDDARSEASQFLIEISEIRSKFHNKMRPSSMWLYGTKYGTALDGRLLVLIRRLMDVNESHLLPPIMKTYANAAFNSSI